MAQCHGNVTERDSSLCCIWPAYPVGQHYKVTIHVHQDNPSPDFVVSQSNLELKVTIRSHLSHNQVSLCLPVCLESIPLLPYPRQVTVVCCPLMASDFISRAFYKAERYWSAKRPEADDRRSGSPGVVTSSAPLSDLYLVRSLIQ